jgi:hypothetical protein
MYSGSDRSSLTSGSPNTSPIQQNSSPIQQQAQLMPPSALPNPAVRSSRQHYQPGSQTQAPAAAQPKLHQPLAQRGAACRAIPIIDPATGIVASPPPSVSPTRQSRLPAVHFVPAPSQVWQ